MYCLCVRVTWLRERSSCTSNELQQLTYSSIICWYARGLLTWLNFLMLLWLQSRSIIYLLRGGRWMYPRIFATFGIFWSTFLLRFFFFKVPWRRMIIVYLIFVFFLNNPSMLSGSLESSLYGKSCDLLLAPGAIIVYYYFFMI